jgi:hypothetical protein
MQEVQMRRLALAALAALCATGAALAGTAPAFAGDSGCTGTIRITSLSWSPPQVRRGQGSALTLVARNCTGRPLPGTLAYTARWLTATPGWPQGCPIYDPTPPMPVTITAPTYTATQRFGTILNCAATGFQLTAILSAGGTSVAASADLLITS